MIRNLKTLGLALVAAFALSAIAASGVMASTPAHFKAHASPAKFHIEQDGTGSTATQLFTTSYGGVDCDIFTADGTDDDGTADELTTTDVTYNNSDGSCEITGLGLEAAIDFNDCHYTFHAGTWLGNGEATGSADLECGTEVVEINAPGCQITVPEQTDLNHIVYHQVDPPVGKDYVTAEATVTGITYIGHKLFCNSGTTLTHNGTYTGNAIATAFTDPGGQAVDATILPKT